MGGFIYEIVCVSTGKRYVGSTADISARWSAHAWLLRAGRHHSRRLQNAWNKYGVRAFVWRILELVEGDLVLAEQNWLDRTLNGYNVCPTAGSTLGLKRSASTRRAISIARKGMKFPQSHCDAIGRAKRGRQLSEDHKQKLRAALSGIRRSPKTIAKIRSNSIKQWAAPGARELIGARISASKRA